MLTGALKREVKRVRRERKLRGVLGGAPHSAHETIRMIHERLRLGIISGGGKESLTSTNSSTP